MLLKALSEFAQSRPEVLADLAFEMKSIRWVIPLAKDGALVGNGLLETEGEKNWGKEFSAPQTSRAKDAGGVAEFLADGLTAVFGLDFDPEEKMDPKKRRDRDINNARKKEDFWRQIEEAAIATDNPALYAICTFRDALGGGLPVFLRFGQKAGTTDKSREKHRWWVTGADGAEKALGNNDAFTFQVDGVLPLFDEEQVRPYWRGIYGEEVAARAKKAPRGVCLVTGIEDMPIELTHLPKIKGVRGAKPSGAAIVSFDKPSFTSYGFAQSLNAPVSFDAVSAYCNGLNALLNSENHSLAIAGTAICFWAKESDAATSFVARMLRSPQAKEVADFLRSPWAGIDRQGARLEQFYSVTLCGNAGRIAVRHWLQSTVEVARNNFKEWFQDLDITEIPWGGESIKPPLAIGTLAQSTVRDSNKLLSEVPEQLYRAALENVTPSVLLVRSILHRMSVDIAKFGTGILFTPILPKTLRAIREAGQPIPPPGVSRFALLKLILNRLNRNRKEGDPMIEAKVFETDDQAYNCGRLLAVLAEIQAKAHDYKLSGAGVAERYFGTASVSPASVFPLLLRLNRHHLDKIKKSPRYGGDERFLEDDIQTILTKFKPDAPTEAPEFPRHMTLQEQGRFAIGFYQQKADTEQRKQGGGNSNKEATNDQV